MPVLTPPSAEYKDSFMGALAEYHAERRFLSWDANDLTADFPTFIDTLRRKETDPQGDDVPESIFWLVEGATYIGRANLRHQLNDGLRRIGGNLGYDVRPSMRQRGYGDLICKLGMDEARKLGLKRVLLTCDEDNPASRKIIEGNGGVFEGSEVVHRPGVLCLRYWIDV
jgi:predicted acetyltransferase